MLNCYDLHNFSYEQEHGTEQMFGPTNEVYVALEKIYWMLILRTLLMSVLADALLKVLVSHFRNL